MAIEIRIVTTLDAKRRTKLQDPHRSGASVTRQSSGNATDIRQSEASVNHTRSRSQANKSNAMSAEHLVLALEGLPSALSGLSAGMLYALMLDTHSIRVAVAAQSLSSSAHSNAPSVLVTTHDPHAFVKKATKFSPKLESQLASGDSRILRLEPDVSRRLLRFGSAKLIDDLKAQNIAPYSLLIIDQANRVLGISDPATASVTAQLFQAWAEASHLAILFLLESDQENPREYATLKSVAEHWGGLGVVKSSASKASITFKHWFGSQGVTPGGRFTMGLSSQGSLGVLPSTTLATAQDATTIAVSPDDSSVISTTQALAGLGDLGRHTRFCDDPLELLDFARRARGGTVLLHFSHRNELDRLAKLVANLRSITAPQVRIIVRECGAKLRKGDNYALLQLGASFVLPKDIPAESARILIDQIGTAALKRNHNPQAAEQLRALLAESSGRLLAPFEFRLRVTNLLDLSDASLPNTLVILKTPLAGLASKVAQLIATRVRDVMFSDVQGRLLLFLFGCNVEAASVVMDRLFVSRKDADRAWDCWSVPEEIRTRLASIEEQPRSERVSPIAATSMIQFPSAAAKRAG